MMRSRLLLCLLAALFISLGAQEALAQYPTKPVRIVVPYSAGSASDTLVRTIGEPLGKALGQPIVNSERRRLGPRCSRA